jgi:hypothetical protein
VFASFLVAVSRIKDGRIEIEIGTEKSRARLGIDDRYDWSTSIAA